MYDYVAKPRPPRKLTPLPPQGKEKTTQGVRPGYDARQGNPWPLTLFIFYHYGGVTVSFFHFVFFPLSVWARGLGPGKNKHMKPPERGGGHLAINRAGVIMIYASKGRHWRPLSDKRNRINFIKNCLLQLSHLEPREAGGAKPGAKSAPARAGWGALGPKEAC